jgi:PAS domain-containing protein
MPWFHGRSNRYGRSSHARPLAIERTHRRTFGSLEFAAQLATLVFALWLVFGSRLSESYDLFYLIFLPVIWVAVRQGIPGVTTAILLLNLGSMVMLNFYPEDLYHLAMLQFLTLIVSLTGLTLGTLITERRSIEDGLRKSEDRLKAIVDAIDEVIFEIDREGRLAGSPRPLARRPTHPRPTGQAHRRRRRVVIPRHPRQSHRNLQSRRDSGHHPPRAFPPGSRRQCFRHRLGRPRPFQIR